MSAVPAPVPTPYRVSTITCNGHIGTEVNLALFHRHIAITTPDIVMSATAPGFVYSETSPTDVRGVYPKRRRGGAEKPRRLFDNQVTVIFYFRDAYMPNVKLFRNGNIHMTGVRTLNDGQHIVERMADEVRRIGDIDPAIAEVAQVVAGQFKVRMINCDFAVPFLIRRKDLHHMLIGGPFHILSSFQPNTYPGVKIQYYYNNATTTDGRCQCTAPCCGRGIGHGEGECKKVTVAVFESGKVLVTGATTYDQVNEAYAFICKVLVEHVDRLQKTLPMLAA